jgi:hypothetical protein
MERMTKRRAQTLLESFNFAFEGIIHVLRTQRNMRIHFLAAVIVLVTAVAIGVSRLELIALLLAIAFVFIAEMINPRSSRRSTSRPPRSTHSRSGEEHRRGGGADRDCERRRDRVPGLLRRGGRP